VANEDEGDSGMLCSSDVGKCVEIIDNVVEVGDECTLPAGAPVTDVIVCVDDRSPGCERLGDMGISSTVLSVSVDDLNDPSGGTVRLPAPIEHGAF
jgi:hypothetical protein